MPWRSVTSNTTSWRDWAPHRCSYRNLRDGALQACVRERSIAKIQVTGWSIAEQLAPLVAQRLRPIKMAPTGTTVTLDTLRMPHMLWHLSAGEFKSRLHLLPSANATQLRLWLGAGFVTSEREAHTTLERGAQFTHLAEPILRAKGWRKLDFAAPAAAFAFDTAGQNDGLHVGGPPLRVAVDKLFHTICSD
jgi:hypothetical protein